MTLLLTSLIIGAAFLGEATFGFAGGMISVPLLTLLLGVKDAVTVVLVFQLLMGLLLFSSWSAIDQAGAKRAVLGVFVGTAAGTFLLGSVSSVALKITLLSVIVGYLTRELLAPTIKLSFLGPIAAGLVGGLGGGFLQGLVGMGGPPFLIYLNSLGISKHSFRATIILLLFVSNVVRLPVSLAANLFNEVVQEVVLCALPLFLIAIFVGHNLHGTIPDKLYRISVYGVLVASAVSIATQVSWQ